MSFVLAVSKVGVRCCTGTEGLTETGALHHETSARLQLDVLYNYAKMLSILRKARLKDKEMRILMLCVSRSIWHMQVVLLTGYKRVRQCREDNDC